MKKERPEILDSGELRRRAEETLRGKIDPSAGLPAAKIDPLRLINELEVHQIELEMQNNELLRSRAELQALLEQYNELYDFAPVGYFSLEPDGTIQRANLTGASLLGFVRSQLTRRRFGQFVVFEQRPVFSAFLRRVFSSQGSQATCEICLEGTGSGQRWVQMQAAGSAGQPDCKVAVIDITSRRQADEGLRLFKTVFDRSSEACAISDSAGRLIYINAAHEKLFGRSLAEAQKLNYRDFYPPESIEVLNSQVAPALERGESWEGELDVFDADGRRFPLWEQADSCFDSDNKLQYAFGFMHAITERKRAEHELKESERRLQQLNIDLEQAQAVAHIGSWKWNIKTAEVEWSDEMYRIFGIGRNAYTGRLGAVIARVIHPDDLHIVLPSNAAAFASNRPQEYRIIRPEDGSIRHIWAKAGESILDEQGNPEFLTGIAQDVTERKQTEVALLESEKRHRLISDLMSDYVYEGWLSADGTTTTDWISGAFEPITGYSLEEIKSQPGGFFSLLVAADVSALLKLQPDLRAGKSIEIEYRISCKNGETRWLRDYMRPVLSEKPEQGIQLLGAVQDITKKKQAEENLRLSNERFNTLFQNLPLQGIIYRFIRDAHGEIVDWECSDCNSLGAESIGLPASDLIGKRASELFSPEVIAPYIQLSRQVFIDGQPRQLETHLEINHRDYLSSVFLVGNEYYANISFDITERKQIELEIAKLAKFPSENPNPVLRLDKNGIILYANPASEPILSAWGCQVNEVAPENWCERVTVALKTDQIQELELDYSGRLFSIKIAPIYDQQYVNLYGEEITVRRQAELALRASEEKYRGLMESLNSVVATLDYDGKFLYLNELAALGIGDTSENLTGKSIHALFPAEMASSLMDRIRQVMDSDRDIVFEDISIMSVQPRWGRTSIQPIHDENNKVAYVLVNITDIDDLKTTQRELQELNRTLEQRVRERSAEVQDLYENAPTGYHSLDANGVVLMINQTELNWLGFSREEIIGHRVDEFFSPSSKQVFMEKFPVFKQRGWLKDVELEYIRKDGTTLFALVSSSAVNNEPGDFVMSRSTVFDNTERKAAQESLRHAYRELEHALGLKDEFLTNMSHELRTPLNSILGLSEILLLGVRGPLNEHQQKFVQGIDSSGRHLLSLINDLLDVSKIEAGKLDLHLEVGSISDICNSSLNFVKSQALKKNIQLEIVPEPAVPSLKADQRRLKQILVNLLGNAVKFTSNGGKVQLRVAADYEHRRLEFSVTDTGIGIAPDDLKRLFRPFTQVDSSLSRQYEGTGLGLALVKRLTEMHGGSVSVSSQVGIGSCFTIALPWEPVPYALQASAAPQSPAQPGTQANKTVVPPPGCLGTILIAEDNPDNLEMMIDFLESLGYQVFSALNGREVLQKVEITSPDLILMDIQMPEMDGLEATRHLRADPRFAKIPIVALTALAMPGDKERCLAAGVNEFATKPIRLKDLEKLVEQLLDKD